MDERLVGMPRAVDGQDLADNLGELASASGRLVRLVHLVIVERAFQPRGAGAHAEEVQPAAAAAVAAPAAAAHAQAHARAAHACHRQRRHHRVELAASRASPAAPPSRCSSS